MEDKIRSDRWLHDAIATTLDEVRRWLLTARRVLLSPRAFTDAWGRSEVVGMNPLGFFAASLAVVGVVDQLASLGRAREAGVNRLWDAVGPIVGPYVGYLLLALTCALFLRAARRPAPIWVAIGLVLYAAGPIELLTTTLVDASQRALSGDALKVAQIVAICGSYLWFAVVFVLGFATLHRVRPWAMLACFLLAQVCVAFLYGNVLPQGPWGLHAYAKVVLTGGEHSVGVGLNLAR